MTARSHWAWLLPVLALSPLALAAKGCDNTGVVGNNCPTADDCPGGTAGQGSVEPGGTCGGLVGAACAASEYCEFPKDAACGAGDQTGVCKPKPEACDLDYSPVCGCDGKTYGNSCAAQMAGVSIARTGECGGGSGGVGETCGGIANLLCEEGLFCNYPVEAECGAGDQTGKCAPITPACSKELNEVCGCDGKSYGNPCTAAAAGQSIAHQGACQPGAVTCRIGMCASGEFCNFPPSSSCGITDGPGVCTKIPPEGTACDTNYDPVCGCDGKTYGNECEALVAGVSVKTEGACGKTCGGFTGEQCDSGAFCDYPLDAECGAADGQGVCKAIPNACTDHVEPVCGCDGKDYFNPCEANAAGTAVASAGECQK